MQSDDERYPQEFSHADSVLAARCKVRVNDVGAHLSQVPEKLWRSAGLVIENASQPSKRSRRIGQSDNRSAGHGERLLRRKDAYILRFIPLQCGRLCLNKCL